jgi:MFS family permease
MGAAIALGTTVAFPLGGAIGAESMFLLCSIGASLLLLCALLAFLLLEADIQGQARSLRDALFVLREQPYLAIPYCFTFIDRFTVGFFAITFPLYAASQFGMNAAVSGKLLAGYLLPFSLLTMPVGRLVDRYGGIRLMLVGSFLYGIAVMLVGFVPPSMLLSLMVVCGILASVMYAPSLWMAASLSPSEKRASTMGGFNAAGSLGFALGPIAGALISDGFGYTAAFAAAGATELICVLALYPVLKRVLKSGPLSFENVRMN